MESLSDNPLNQLSCVERSNPVQRISQALLQGRSRPSDQSHNRHDEQQHEKQSEKEVVSEFGGAVENFVFVNAVPNTTSKFFRAESGHVPGCVRHARLDEVSRRDVCWRAQCYRVPGLQMFGSAATCDDRQGRAIDKIEN